MTIRYSCPGISFIILLLALMISGCASTRQFVPVPDQSKVTDSTVYIEVKRLKRFAGGGNGFKVKDNGKHIGDIGPDGVLLWERKPGLMNLVVAPKIPGTFLNCSPVVENLQGAMKYSYNVGFPSALFSRKCIEKIASEPLTVTDHSEGQAGIVQSEPPSQPGKMTSSRSFQLDSSKASLMVMDIVPKKVDKVTASALSDIIKSKLSEYYNVQSMDALSAVSGVVEQKLKAGCDDTQCIMEVAGAMDIGLVVTGNISNFGKLYTLNLMLISTKGVNTGVIKRASEKCNCTDEELVGFAEDAALKLIGVVR